MFQSIFRFFKKHKTLVESVGISVIIPTSQERTLARQVIKDLKKGEQISLILPENTGIGQVVAEQGYHVAKFNGSNRGLAEFAFWR